jgi:hypothetical protein
MAPAVPLQADANRKRFMAGRMIKMRCFMSGVSGWMAAERFLFSRVASWAGPGPGREGGWFLSLSVGTEGIALTAEGEVSGRKPSLDLESLPDALSNSWGE